MNLLINEPPLQVLPSLAKRIGLNEAIILQQLHFRSLISNNMKDGHKWIYKTYDEWQEEFPFWSADTIKRAIRKLEKEGYVISTSAFNKMKMDKTKWYRIDYSKCHVPTGQNAPSMGAKRTDGEGQNAPCDEGKMPPAITKEIKRVKTDNVDKALDTASQIINHLNFKTGKNFSSRSKATQRLINARLSEGHALEDFKTVIDVKAKQWLNDQQMSSYLRPSTLFSPTNFENYLNEVPAAKPVPKPATYQPPVLDFEKGEFN
ncbi:hypothetical protein SLU01_19090 [Sporosarcina luteola]|uniref:Phage conserved hypothetical protein C-terminal domain-containing protein n=1 Tax=Sporosarcina luteola TaxID=582850 RepID=A0A511Z831_9BACL|nr:conserved phage C-terminal domain-containing protein [Sporosarcina luteola]GEN83597.1 hypothetical protein SLU01_19090 [Sporosarcina luteola]